MTFGGFFQRQDDFKTLFPISIEAVFPREPGGAAAARAPSAALKN
jgi:hypothetical protein